MSEREDTGGRPSWLWRIWNAQRPTSIFGRLGLLGLSLFVIAVVLNAGWLEAPKHRLGGAAVLAMSVAFFCLACGRRKVKIVKRATPQSASRPALRAVPEPRDGDARSARWSGRWSMRAAAAVLAGVVAVVLQHGFHV